MKKILSLILALVATTTLWAYDFQSGDLYYNITSSSAPYTVEVDDATSSITIATIPETVTYNGTTYSVTTIGDYAFMGCSSLTSVTIPNSVTSIGSSAFHSCSSIASITIPNSVTSIRGMTFAYCDSLTSVIIPNSVTSIGGSAFFACRSLSSIAIPDGVTSIGDWAFTACTFVNGEFKNNSSLNAESNNYWGAEIVDVDIDGLLIRSDTVIDCRPYVISATIPNSVTCIGNDAFGDCFSLTSVTIPNSVTSIEDYAFYYCSSLTSITIPNSVTSIGLLAFAGCSSLASMVVESSNSTYDSRENCNAIIETATNTLIAGCQNTIIPNSITSIGDYAFGECFSLTSITIPNSVTSIGEWAFTYCESLTSITIPNSVTSIGEGAFEGCSSLTTVICEAIEVPELGDDVFYDMPLSEATLYVPAQSLDDYKAADQWKDFGTILPIHESPTNIEHTPLGEIGNQSKLLRNGQLLILRDGKTYTITGQKL